MNNDLSVLVVDDDDDIRYALTRMFKKCNCAVNDVASVEDALNELSTHHYDVVFSDMWFHGTMGGEELLETAIHQFPQTKIVLISCSMDSSRIATLKSKGAALCLQKPFFKDTCLDVLSQLGQSQQKAA